MANYDKAMAYLAKLPPAVSGSGGHSATLRAACEIVRFGLTDGEAREALQWFNENKCRPQWTAAELAHKLSDARRLPHHGERGRAGAQQHGRVRRKTFTPPDMTRYGLPNHGAAGAASGAQSGPADEMRPADVGQTLACPAAQPDGGPDWDGAIVRLEDWLTFKAAHGLKAGEYHLEPVWH